MIFIWDGGKENINMMISQILTHRNNTIVDRNTKANLKMVKKVEEVYIIIQMEIIEKVDSLMI